VSKTCNSSQH